MSTSARGALNQAILAFSANAALQRCLAACIRIDHLRWPLGAALSCAAGKRRYISVPLEFIADRSLLHSVDIAGSATPGFPEAGCCE